MNNNSQKGFGAIEAILVLVILSIIGGVGYYVYSSNQSKPASTDIQPQVSTPESAANGSVPEIKNSQDLDKAGAALDQQDENNDLNEATSLEKDINNL